MVSRIGVELENEKNKLENAQSEILDLKTE